MEKTQKTKIPAWGWVWYPLSTFMAFVFAQSVQSIFTSDGFVTPSQMQEHQAVLTGKEIKVYEAKTTNSPSNKGISHNFGRGKIDNSTTARTIGQTMFRLELKLEGQPAFAATKHIPEKEHAWQEFTREVNVGDEIVLKFFKPSLEKAKEDDSNPLVIYGLRTDKKDFIKYTNIALFFEFWAWEIFTLLLAVFSWRFFWKWWKKARKWSENKKRGFYAAEFESKS